MFVALGLGMEVTIVLASTPRRARSHLSAGVVAVLACTLAACDDGDTVSRTAPDVTDTTAPDVTDPAAGDEKVVVVFDGLTGAEGRTIVGVFNPERSTALGGFRLDVDTGAARRASTVVSEATCANPTAICACGRRVLVALPDGAMTALAEP